MKVNELMSFPVISVQLDTTLKEIMQLLRTHRISSVPVVSADERLVGIIGWNELFPSTRYIRVSDVSAPVVFKRITDPKNIVTSYKSAVHLTAREIMSPRPVYRDADDHLDELIFTMAKEKLHMIPIVKEERLVGVLTRTDVVRYLSIVL